MIAPLHARTGPPPAPPHVPAAHQGGPDHISPTSAKSYLSCSLRFYFERVRRLEKPVPPALHLGKAVHAALQAFHLARWRGQDDSPEATAAAFQKAFQDGLEEGVSYPDPAACEKARQDGLRVVAAYLDSPEALNELPLAVEVPLEEKIAGVPVPVSGVLDLVRRDHTPVDFKSAAAKPQADMAAFDHELQLVTYQLLIEATTGETPPALEVVHLVKTKIPKVVKVSVPPADAARKRRVVRLLATAVDGIAEGRFHPQPGMHCSWCQYRRECAAWPQSEERRMS